MDEVGRGQMGEILRNLGSRLRNSRIGGIEDQRGDGATVADTDTVGLVGCGNHRQRFQLGLVQ